MSELAQLKHTVADLRAEVDSLQRERKQLTETIGRLQNERFAASGASGWQEITTAPDNTPILTFRGVGLMAVAEHIQHPAVYPNGQRTIWICTDGMELLNVTHWMPLPTPPSPPQEPRS